MNHHIQGLLFYIIMMINVYPFITMWKTLSFPQIDFKGDDWEYIYKIWWNDIWSSGFITLINLIRWKIL